MALLVMVRVSLGHFDTFIRLLDIFLEGNFMILKRINHPAKADKDSCMGVISNYSQ